MTAGQGENLSYEQLVELRWQGEWHRRFTKLSADAGLSDMQEVCYYGYLRGLNAQQIAHELFGDPGPCPPMPEKRKRKSWHRQVSLRQIRVDCAIVQAEERIAQHFPQFGAAGAEFKRQLLTCFRNRGEDWATIPFIQTTQDEPQRCPSARVLTTADLGRVSRSQALRLHVQNLAADVERGRLNPVI